MLLCDVFHGRSGTSYQELASSHKISLFGEHFIKTGIFDRGLGKTLNDAYDKRLIGDYGIGFIVTEGESRDILETAKNFVQTLKSYLKIWMEKVEKEKI